MLTVARFFRGLPIRGGLVLAVITAAGCSAPAGPTPSPVPSGVPAPQGLAVATLAVSSFEVTLGGTSSGVFWYRPTMVLTETSGKSAATLQSIVFSIPNGDTFTIGTNFPPGQGCFLTPQSKIVPTGKAWDINNVYYYCLDIDSRSDLSGGQIRVAVTFADQDGRPGTVSGTATVKE